MIDLSRATCGYCNHRAHTTEREGDAVVPVCKDHASRHGGAPKPCPAVSSQPSTDVPERLGPERTP